MVFSPDKRSERPVNQMVRPPAVWVWHARVLAKPGCVIGVTPPVAPRARPARRRFRPDWQRWSGNEVPLFDDVIQRSSQRGGVHG
jgi:hypothetical protein